MSGGGDGLIGCEYTHTKTQTHKKEEGMEKSEYSLSLKNVPVSYEP